MKVAIGCDHHGVDVKELLLKRLSEQGHDVYDAGTHSRDAVDYPDVAGAVSRRVRDGDSDRGVLICGSGIGMSITANKHLGVRAAVCTDVGTAKLSRQHNDTNIVCLSGERVDPNVNEQIVDIWLATPFDGGRHKRRVDKISQIENSCQT